MTPPAPLAVSLGDPAGVGPEIVAGAWEALRGSGPAFFVVGDADVVQAASRGRTPARRISGAREALEAFSSALPVLDLPLAAPVVAGQPSPRNAEAVVRWIETGAGLALSGQAAALVTAPISKATLYASGFTFPGHTEFLAELSLGPEASRPADAHGPETPPGPVMMLTAAGLRTALVTIHLPLREAIASLTLSGIVRTGRVLDAALRRDFGIERPRIALAGLNPHAGEAGALGREEIELLQPAAAELRRLGADCSDPRPADSLFHAEARAGYDAVLCLYHDQALIPVKTLDFWGGVNVTLGLPLVRTSPDHGAGFDIAGRGLARPDSLVAALRLAREMADRRRARA